MKSLGLMAALGLFASVAAAQAGTVIPYGNVNTENTEIYSFTAMNTGDLSAYFDGTGASFDESLGLLVNGVDTGLTGLANHSSAVGDQFDFGNVTAGDALTFYITVDDFNGSTYKYYSDPSLNVNGENHAYSAAFTASNGIPDGTYVGFEDLSLVNDGSSDWNYTDEQFVFTNTATVITSAVPEPATWAMFLLGFGAIGFGLRSARRKAVTA